MKKYLAVGAIAVIMAIGFFSMTVAEEAAEFTIIGYGPLQFAVVGEIERQANEMIESWGTKKPAKIVVQGFADKTGKAAENDKIALDRAREIAVFLESKTGAGRIFQRSMGDWEDARKVVVTVEFTVALPPASLPTAQPQTSIFKMALILSAIVLVICLLNILVDRRSRRRKAEKTTAQPLAAKSTEPTMGTKWIEVDGCLVFIEYAVSEGRWYSPFTNASGGRVYEPTQTKIIGSVRRCLNNSKFSGQVNSLKDAGLIRLIQ